MYYVNFEPIRFGEFGKHHLAIVLNKSNDNITFIVVPLTSKAEGNNGKIQIDVKEQLPSHLRNKETYAVYDQIRTVSASRFQRLTDNGETWDAIVPKSEMKRVIQAVVKNILSDLPNEAQRELLSSIISDNTGINYANSDSKSCKSE